MKRLLVLFALFPLTSCGVLGSSYPDEEELKDKTGTMCRDWAKGKLESIDYKLLAHQKEELKVETIAEPAAKRMTMDWYISKVPKSADAVEQITDRSMAKVHCEAELKKGDDTIRGTRIYFSSFDGFDNELVYKDIDFDRKAQKINEP